MLCCPPSFLALSILARHCTVRMGPRAADRTGHTRTQLMGSMRVRFCFDIYNLTKSSVSLLDSCSWQSGVQFRLVHWASEPEDQNFQPPFCNMRVVQSKGLTPYAIRAGTSKFVASSTRMTYLFSGSVTDQSVIWRRCLLFFSAAMRSQGSGQTNAWPGRPFLEDSIGA